METRAELEGELNEVAGHLNAQHARLVDAAADMLRNEHLWCDETLPTAAKYLTWRTAVSPERAAQIVAVAERVDDLPSCMARFRAGELSLDQMAPIAKRVPWWADDEVAELAAKLTVQQVRGLVARYRFPAIPHPDEAERADGTDDTDPSPDRGGPSDGQTPDGDGATPAGAPGDDDRNDTTTGTTTDTTTDTTTGAAPGDDDGRGPADPTEESLWWGWGDDGRFRFHGILDADTGLIVESALRESRDRLGGEGGAGGAGASWPDALRDIAERSLDAIGAPARRDRFRVHVHLDTDGSLIDQQGRWLPEAIRRHICCDGRVGAVLRDNATPIGVGRSQHIVPPRTRRQVLLRDHGCCQVPGCGNTTFVEIHHIIHWEHGGETETDNLISLCPRHHRLHHRGLLGISGNADVVDGVIFTNRHGRPIPASGARPEPPGAPPDPPSGDFRHPLGERLESRWVHFNEPRPRHLQPVS